MNTPNNLAFYEYQLDKVFNKARTQYAPTFKIFSNGNGEDTKHISLHSESAAVLIEWLKKEFIDK